MPKHVFEKFYKDGKVDIEAFNTFEYNPPLGLKLRHSFDPAGMWTAWEKRDDWAKTPTGMMFGEPKPKYVVFVDYGDFTARVIAMTRHEVDMIDLDLPAIRRLRKRIPRPAAISRNRTTPGSSPTGIRASAASSSTP